MADNSTQGGTDVIRDKDRAGVKTQIYGADLNIGGASEVLQTATALADATANPTVPAWAMHGMLFNGTTWDRMRGDTTNGLDVDVTRLPALPAGTNNIGDVDVLTLPSLPAGAAVIGKVDINSAPQVAVNNVETLTDNAGFTDGTSKLFPQGYIFDESAGTALTENDVAAARVDSKRAVVNVLEDATTRGRRAAVSATGGLLGDQGAPAVQANAWFVRPRKIATFRAVYRSAARIYTLSKAFTAGSRFQFATIHHAATATKTVRLRAVVLTLFSNSGSANVEASLVRITTAPATGNPAITPSPAESNDTVEATCLALPTTNATETTFWAQQAFSLGATGAIPTTNPPPPIQRVELLRVTPGDDESKLPAIRAGVLEGWAVTLDSDGVSTILAKVEIEFSEE